MVIINELKKWNVQNVQILVDKGDKGASTIKSICKLNYTPNALSWIFFWGRSERKRSAFGWLDEGMVGYWPKVFLRARVFALPYWSFVFLLSQVSQCMEWKTFFTLKTTGCFMQSDRLFYEK